MAFSAHKTAYKNTNAFSALVLDYLADDAELKPFYQFRPDRAGIEEAVKQRKDFPVNRQLLSKVLLEQYKDINVSPALRRNIESLSEKNTFTVCTAHQPNIFTGHLYFIYKIIHAIKLCNDLNAEGGEAFFVPVYYMGSEDADIAELGEVQVNDKKYQWHTDQKGAVGRMNTDAALGEILAGIEGQLSVEPFGPKIIGLLKNAYQKDISIEKATFYFVHELFNEFGLVILLPDDRRLKSMLSNTVIRELKEGFSSAAVRQTVSAFPGKYKVQATGRDINLFYLDAGIRERIEKSGDDFIVANTGLKFSAEEMFALAVAEPEKFSPNVILRPVYQEMILPDIAFIGGGGEMAYWLELKNVFEAAGAFFPVLILRNSFTLLKEQTAEKLTSLGLSMNDIFKTTDQLLEDIVRSHTDKNTELKDETEAMRALYDSIRMRAADIDVTLSGHVHALRTAALNRLGILEKKMLKAEKKKYEAQHRQIKKIKESAAPGGTLQERVENILPWYALYGPELLNEILKDSGGLEQEFTILSAGSAD